MRKFISTITGALMMFAMSVPLTTTAKSAAATTKSRAIAGAQSAA